MNDAIFAALARAGWTAEAPRPGADVRLALTRADGSRLVIERRGDVLWLVIDEPGERRVLGIRPTAAPAAVAAAIVALQGSLSVGSYLMAYGELGEIGDVSIIAWEQLDPQWR
jgi:hypothetical protein